MSESLRAKLARLDELLAWAGISRLVAREALMKHDGDPHRALLAMVEERELTLEDLHRDACPPAIVARAEELAGAGPHAAAEGTSMKKIDDPDFGALTYDEDLASWTGRLQTAAFGDCAIKWNLSLEGELSEPTEEHDSGPADGLVVNISDASGTGPGSHQRAALSAFRAGETKIVAAVLEEVARVARENYVTADQMDDDAPALTSQRDLADRLCTADGVRDWLSRPRIDFHATGEGGVSFTSFNFGAGFDEEHGIAVLMLRDGVREVGGASEFYDR